MLRTQIYLPKEYHSELSWLAKKLGVPMSEVIRRMLKSGIAKKHELLPTANDLMSLARLKIRGGPKDLSAKFDSYLYG